MAESYRSISLAPFTCQSERKTETANDSDETSYTKEVIHYSSTVAPVLVATSIKQAPVLSKHFYVPQLVLHANEPVLSKHLPNVASGH